MKIENFIFDLGGVFLDIDYKKTSRAFAEAGITNFDDYYHQSFASPLFANFETGFITSEAFLDGLRKISNSNLQNHQIVIAWNAMLGALRVPSLSFLLELKKKYGVFLLSNTNQIHFDAFKKIWSASLGDVPLKNYFNQTYFSHLIHLKKPNAAAYELIVQQHYLNPNATLFIDDTLINIAGAEAVGLQTCYLQTPELVEDVLKQYV